MVESDFQSYKMDEAGFTRSCKYVMKDGKRSKMQGNPAIYREVQKL